MASQQQQLRVPTQNVQATDMTTLAATLACVLIGLIVLFFLWKGLIGPGRKLVVLLCGPPSSGKTKVFTQMAWGKTMPTVTSQMPNAATCDLSTVCTKKEGIRPIEAQLVDIPGSRQLLARFLPEYVPSATAVVFMLKMFTLGTSPYLAATADSLLQLVETSLLGTKRKNSNLRLLFVIQPDDLDNVVFSSVVQSVQNQLQTEIDRLTRTGSSDTIPLGGANAASSSSAISLSKLAKRVDWIVSKADDENDMANARDVADWLMK